MNGPLEAACRAENRKGAGSKGAEKQNESERATERERALRRRRRWRIFIFDTLSIVFGCKANLGAVVIRKLFVADFLGHPVVSILLLAFSRRPVSVRLVDEPQEHNRARVSLDLVCRSIRLACPCPGDACVRLRSAASIPLRCLVRIEVFGACSQGNKKRLENATFCVGHFCFVSGVIVASVLARVWRSESGASI